MNISAESLDHSKLRSLSFDTDAGFGQRARLGLIVLQTDQTIEPEIASLLPADGVTLYHTRIPNQMEVSPESLTGMEAQLPVTAALLPPRFEFDAIGYGCTSASTLIGESRVAELIQDIHPGARCSNPITACKAALNSLGVNRIALVTPYVPSVTLPMRENLIQAGFEINALATFNQSDDFVVARIASQSIRDSIMDVGARGDCDAVFVSCTSLRVLPVIVETEQILNKPVLASNQVLAWHLLRLCGIQDNIPHGGRLFSRTLS